MNPILIRPVDDGRYDELLKVCEHVKLRYGSASNALAQMAMDSDSYRDAKAEWEQSLKKPKGRGTKATA